MQTTINHRLTVEQLLRSKRLSLKLLGYMIQRLPALFPILVQVKAFSRSLRFWALWHLWPYCYMAFLLLKRLPSLIPLLWRLPARLVLLLLRSSPVRYLGRLLLRLLVMLLVWLLILFLLVRLLRWFLL